MQRALIKASALLLLTSTFSTHADASNACVGPDEGTGGLGNIVPDLISVSDNGIDCVGSKCSIVFTLDMAYERRRLMGLTFVKGQFGGGETLFVPLHVVRASIEGRYQSSISGTKQELYDAFIWAMYMVDEQNCYALGRLILAEQLAKVELKE